MGWKSDLNLNFYDPTQILQKKKKKKKREKKIFICGNISLVIALWVDILIVYIALNQISPHFSVSSTQGILQILRSVPSSLLHRCSHYSMIRPNCFIAATELFAAPRDVFLFFISYLLSSSSFSLTFSALFCCSKFLRVSFIEAFWEMFSGVSSTFLCDLMGNSHCKKDYSKSEVNLPENTQIKL